MFSIACAAAERCAVNHVRVRFFNGIGSTQPVHSYFQVLQFIPKIKGGVVIDCYVSTYRLLIIEMSS